MLSDYAKQNLADANALLLKSADALDNIEMEHPDNRDNIEHLVSVPLNSGQLREQLELIERALHLLSEALDIPVMVAQCGHAEIETKCRKCGTSGTTHLESPEPSEVKDFLFRLVNTYAEHRDEIDEFIRQAKAKWKIERMVSIDRDIVRLACAEAFFITDVPINVCVSEAVELSHRFADEKAVKFINGILGDLARHASQYRKTGVLAKLAEPQPDSESTVVPSTS